MSSSNSSTLATAPSRPGVDPVSARFGPQIAVVDFYHTVADLFDRTFGRAEPEGERGDVACNVQEARQAGSPVLELACGTGRVLIPIRPCRGAW